MGAKITFNDQVLRRVQQKVNAELRQSVNDCMDDLVRVSSETAPHDRGILDKSFSKEVTAGAESVTGVVEYVVREKNFNYAIIMHEGEYRLGESSEQKPGGVGMSETHYPVGNKFLTRPLEGEREAYKKHIEAELQKLYKKGD
ncbi:hypothetical protein H1S01_11355 [Heliobacterium chlorum]|uniref:HK97 gp10 family phage protein n=1 Tax=Heliobacterium chlorum TaxID=2698 RepID=A0ABR7T2V6_HELCL|nr:hypothetical protein [Heliobacterium chlorum]MBC9785104.1 hypothetical protein [Heliobacterium chlorum]